MNNSRAQVCIVILAYNSASKLPTQFVHKLLSSIKTQKDIRYKVIIVDNGSQDNTSEVLNMVMEKVGVPGMVIRLNRNYGWAGGNNRGAYYCKDSDYLFFLNDDVILLDENVLINLVRYFEKYKDVGVAQPIIITRNGSSLYGFKLSFAGYMEELNKPVQPSYVIGSALFTRTKLFFEIGMFDEDLFLYHDDVDYCLRTWLAGYKNAVVLNAKVFHLGGISAPNSFYYYAVRNDFLVTTKVSDAKYLFVRILLILIEFLVSWLWYVTYRLRDSNKTKAVIKGFVHGVMHYLPLGIKKRSYIVKKIGESILLKKGIYDIRIDIKRILPFISKF